MANPDLKPNELAKPERRTAAQRMEARRDRRGWRTAPKTSRFGGLTRAGEKSAAKRHENEVIYATRKQVWARSSVCEACGDSQAMTARRHWKSSHEMHEVNSRAMTRGLPAEHRFNTANCMRCCDPCHRDFTEHRKRIVDLTASGMDGSYNVEQKDEHGIWRVVRCAERGIS